MDQKNLNDMALLRIEKKQLKIAQPLRKKIMYQM